MENDNFVHVKLGVHEGTESVVPYYVEPRQTVIPGCCLVFEDRRLATLVVSEMYIEDRFCTRKFHPLEDAYTFAGFLQQLTCALLLRKAVLELEIRFYCLNNFKIS